MSDNPLCHLGCDPALERRPSNCRLRIPSLFFMIAIGALLLAIQAPLAIAEEKAGIRKSDQGSRPGESQGRGQDKEQDKPTVIGQKPQAGEQKTERHAVVEEDRRKESEEAKRLQDLFLRGQTVFIRKGELIAEMSTFYFTDTRSDFVPLGNGGAALVKLRRRFFDTTLVGRYGLLTDGLELDVFLPAYVYTEQEIDTGLGRSRTTSQGLGDMSAALRYQLSDETAGRPSLIIDLEAKSRTGGDVRGTGNWNFGGGVTLLKTIDPVVFFARVGYTQTFGSPGRDLGNIIDYRIGAGFSLNDRVSFNTQLTGAFVGSSKITTPGLAGSAGNVLLTTQSLELMNLLFTATVLLTRQVFVEPVVGVALTDDAFDAIVGLRIPYRF